MEGLSSEQVKSRIAAGETNKTEIKTTSIPGIIKKHSLTIFNILLFVLAALVFFFGQKRDALFILIAVLATLIAIINDIRAKKIVDELNLVSEKPVTVIRDSKETAIPPSKIVKDDTIKFSLGNQIIVDSEIITGELEVNESLITGESDNIKKQAGDKLISGSLVVSGTCFAKVTSVGENTYISGILKNAKQVKTKRSKIFLTIDKIIKINSIVLIPVGILLFIKQLYLDSATIETAVTSTVAALVAMIPEGLVLLTSSVLALATIRLSKQKVLIQDFYSVETLARVDTICLDKTGTLTTGKMKVEKVIPTENHSEKEIIEAVKLINGSLDDSNATSNALIKKFGKTKSEKVNKLYHFSSDKKFSGIRVGEKKFLIGALEFLVKEKSILKTEEELSKNYRVLSLVVEEKGTKEVLGFVLLSDEIRKNAKDLLKFFEENDTKVKIISGDNLFTIRKILETLNLSSLKAVDLSKETEKNYQKLVETYDIFARVTPEQKKYLVKALKKSGHTVAMTGDGVNDCLALKEADCGISIGDGSDAARRVSDIVLMNNDFSAIPSVIFEGRQSINNITRSSALFLSKTIFATVLSVVFIFINFRYPFSPIEMSLINFVIIGAPSFILALETNHSRVRTDFKNHILKNSVPSALATIFVVISISILSKFFDLAWPETIALSCILTSFVGFLLIYKLSRPLNKLRSALFFTLIGIIALVFLISPIRNFFGIAPLTKNLALLSLGLGLISSLIFFISSRLLSRRLS